MSTDRCLAGRFSPRLRGIALIALLVYLAVIATALLASVTLWSHEARRAKEAQLLRVGSEIRRAIGTYYEHTPGNVKRYPATLEDLLEDKRYLTLFRYLRRIHRDPITLETSWGIVASPDGGVMGVYSLSAQAPVKTGNFPHPFESFDSARKYSDWRFIYLPAVTPRAPLPR